MANETPSYQTGLITSDNPDNKYHKNNDHSYITLTKNKEHGCSVSVAIYNGTMLI